MNDATTTTGFPFDRWSLYLFVTGLLGPFVLYLAGTAIVAMSERPLTFFEPAGIAIGFALIAQILAFVFGLLGKRAIAGKVGLIGSAILLVCAFGWLLYSESPTLEGPPARALEIPN